METLTARYIEEELGKIDERLDSEWRVKNENALNNRFEQCKFLYYKSHASYKLKFKKAMTYKAFGKK